MDTGSLSISDTECQSSGDVSAYNVMIKGKTKHLTTFTCNSGVAHGKSKLGTLFELMNDITI